MDDQAYIRFKTELEKDKELHDTYGAKTQGAGVTGRVQLGKAVNETGQPPKATKVDRQRKADERRG